ncbi:ion channel [Flagellimonas sp.]|uniref:ion channel n=1 Tax=Flagellimonas sp. TaxID=2058762 RepID=UPI003B50C76D
MRLQQFLFKGKNNSKWLLLSLIVLLLLPIPVHLLPNFKGIIFQIALSFVVFAGIQLISNSIQHFIVGLVMGCIAILFIWLGSKTGQSGFIKFARIFFTTVFLAFVGYRLLGIISKSKTITLNTIAAAVSGYFLIGLFGGQLCQMINLLIPDSYNLVGGNEAYQLMYFSFTTLTSLGFGDILPVTQSAQSLALLLGITGQLYLTILVAILVGKYLMQEPSKA